MQSQRRPDLYGRGLTRSFKYSRFRTNTHALYSYSLHSKIKPLPSTNFEPFDSHLSPK